MTAKGRLSLTRDPSHRIIIAPDWGGFQVAVEPSRVNQPPEVFAKYRAAGGAAGGVRLTRSWSIDNGCDPDPAEDA